MSISELKNIATSARATRTVSLDGDKLMALLAEITALEARVLAAEADTEEHKLAMSDWKKLAKAAERVAEIRKSEIDYLSKSLAAYPAFIHRAEAAAPKLALRRGDTPEKIAAWRAFIAAMGNEMPTNADGTYNGAYDHAVMCAIQAFLETSYNLLGHQSRLASQLTDHRVAREIVQMFADETNLFMTTAYVQYLITAVEQILRKEAVTPASDTDRKLALAVEALETISARGASAYRYGRWTHDTKDMQQRAIKALADIDKQALGYGQSCANPGERQCVPASRRAKPRQSGRGE